MYVFIVMNVYLLCLNIFTWFLFIVTCVSSG